MRPGCTIWGACGASLILGGRQSAASAILDGGAGSGIPKYLPSALTAGVVTITVAGRSGARTNQISYCCDGSLPPRRRFGSEDAQGRSRDEVSLQIEYVVDGGMDTEEALGRSGRLDPPYFTLSSSHDLMGILGAIVLPQSLLMRTGQAKMTKSGPVRAQLVSRQ